MREEKESSLQVKKTSTEQICQVLDIYERARIFMRRTGNIHQWSDGYPSIDSLEKDMLKNGSYVVEKGGRPVATFFFSMEPEPTYCEIYNGHWLNNQKYGVVHRAASDGTLKGIMDIVIDFCKTKTDNIRIDTHRDNKVMQDALFRNDFKYCGIIHLSNGDERLAFHYSKYSDNE